MSGETTSTANDGAGDGRSFGEASGYTTVDVAKATVATVVMAWLLSLIYGPVDHYSPLVYLNIFLAGLMGWAVGRCGKAMLRRFRIDGRSAATFVGAIAALFALWFSWLSYVWTLFSFEFEAYTAFMNPSLLWDFMGYLAENPAWTITSRSGKAGSAGPSMLYYAIWLVEAVLFVYFSVKECRQFVDTNKLCHQCRDWLRPTGDVAFFAVPADASFLAQLAQGNLEFLKDLPRLQDGAEAEQWLEARCYACGACEGLNAHVTVTHSVIKLDKKKKPQTVTSTLANMAEVTPQLESELFDPAKNAAAAQPGEQPAAPGEPPALPEE